MRNFLSRENAPMIGLLLMAGFGFVAILLMLGTDPFSSGGGR